MSNLKDTYKKVTNATVGKCDFFLTRWRPRDVTFAKCGLVYSFRFFKFYPWPRLTPTSAAMHYGNVQVENCLWELVNNRCLPCNTFSNGIPFYFSIISFWLLTDLLSPLQNHAPRATPITSPACGIVHGENGTLHNVDNVADLPINFITSVSGTFVSDNLFKIYFCN